MGICQSKKADEMHGGIRSSGGPVSVARDKQEGTATPPPDESARYDPGPPSTPPTDDDKSAFVSVATEKASNKSKTSNGIGRAPLPKSPASPATTERTIPETPESSFEDARTIGTTTRAERPLPPPPPPPLLTRTTAGDSPDERDSDDGVCGDDDDDDGNDEQQDDDDVSLISESSSLAPPPPPPPRRTAVGRTANGGEIKANGSSTSGNDGGGGGVASISAEDADALLRRVQDLAAKFNEEEAAAAAAAAAETKEGAEVEERVEAVLGEERGRHPVPTGAPELAEASGRATILRAATAASIAATSQRAPPIDVRGNELLRTRAIERLERQYSDLLVKEEETAAETGVDDEELATEQRLIVEVLALEKSRSAADDGQLPSSSLRSPKFDVADLIDRMEKARKGRRRNGAGEGAGRSAPPSRRGDGEPRRSEETDSAKEKEEKEEEEAASEKNGGRVALASKLAMPTSANAAGRDLSSSTAENRLLIGHNFSSSPSASPSSRRRVPAFVELNNLKMPPPPTSPRSSAASNDATNDAAGEGALKSMDGAASLVVASTVKAAPAHADAPQGPEQRQRHSPSRSATSGRSGANEHRDGEPPKGILRSKVDSSGTDDSAAATAAPPGLNGGIADGRGNLPGTQKRAFEVHGRARLESSRPSSLVEHGPGQRSAAFSPRRKDSTGPAALPSIDESSCHEDGGSGAVDLGFPASLTISAPTAQDSLLPPPPPVTRLSQSHARTSSSSRSRHRKKYSSSSRRRYPSSQGGRRRKKQGSKRRQAESSVNSDILSRFTELQLQVARAKQEEIKRRDVEKKEERKKDIRHNRELLKQLDEMKRELEEWEREKKKMRDGQDGGLLRLHDSASWFFDFEALDDKNFELLKKSLQDTRECVSPGTAGTTKTASTSAEAAAASLSSLQKSISFWERLRSLRGQKESCVS